MIFQLVYGWHGQIYSAGKRSAYMYIYMHVHIHSLYEEFLFYGVENYKLLWYQW